jgi:hypothetical protein
MKRNISCFFLLFFCAALFAQTDSAEALPQDPSSLIGLTLAEVFEKYGAPKSVYPVRGLASWQDDVVLVYDPGDFYIYGTRVWQLKLKAAYGIKEGDPRAQVNLVLGEEQPFDGYSLFSLPSKVWPITLRINWEMERVQAIFVYRSDF